MAATAADVRSILSLPTPGSSSAPTPAPAKKPGPTARKPEGISRELYSLIGPSAPSLAAQLAKPRLKQKPNLGGGVKVKWEWRSFNNGARSDGLQLKHWVRASTDPAEENPFAKYNVQSPSYTYSQDEYTRLLEDPMWTKEETDYLFDIVKEYDLRWYIIHDRYEYPDSSRSLEDLKDRYYSVCRKVVRSRPWPGDDASKAALIASFQFDKEREMTRKKYVASLQNRTPEQIAEEEALYIEIKRLEQNERKFKRDREELLRTLAGIDSGLPDIPDDEPSFSGSILSLDLKKRKKSSAAMDLDVPPTPSNVISLGPPVTKRPPSAKTLAEDAKHCILRFDPPASTSTTKTAHQIAHIRSYKIPQPKLAIHAKVSQALAELGVNCSRLVMPTRENVALLDSLIEATTALVETKKVVDRVDYEIGVLEQRIKDRLKTENGEGGDASSQGNGEAMDVDGAEGADDADAGADADGETVDGRAQSIVSTRSTRSRRPTRDRSPSVSSVGTSATVSTRAGTKRQRRG